MQAHEYVIVGHSRAAVGRHLGTVAAWIAAGSAAVVGFTLDAIRASGHFATIPSVVLWPLSAAIVYPIAHWAFDRWVWKRNFMLKVIGIPNLTGDWSCEGETKDSEGNTTYQWSGKISIAQTWEKLHICLDTGQSRSSSVSAALVRNEAKGFTLMYSYKNEPRIGEKDLYPHTGYAELHFDTNATAGDGDYFNNRGRVTFGRMRITRTGA